MRLHILTLAVCALAAPATAAGDKPPLKDGWYVSRDACPGECCVYRDWIAESDTVLYAAAQSSKQIGTIPAGQTVEALTGDVYVIPVPVEVIHEAIVYETTDAEPLQFSVGETLYVLDYLSEGYQSVWRDGGITELSTDFIGMVTPNGLAAKNHISYQSCTASSESCWWRIAPEHLRQPTEWWVWLRLPGGETGWISSPEKFSNKDSCG